MFCQPPIFFFQKIFLIRADGPPALHFFFLLLPILSTSFLIPLSKKQSVSGCFIYLFS